MKELGFRHQGTSFAGTVKEEECGSAQLYRGCCRIVYTVLNRNHSSGEQETNFTQLLKSSCLWLWTENQSEMIQTCSWICKYPQSWFAQTSAGVLVSSWTPETALGKRRTGPWCLVPLYLCPIPFAAFWSFAAPHCSGSSVCFSEWK